MNMIIDLKILNQTLKINTNLQNTSSNNEVQVNNEVQYYIIFTYFYSIFNFLYINNKNTIYQQ